MHQTIAADQAIDRFEEALANQSNRPAELQIQDTIEHVSGQDPIVVSGNFDTSIWSASRVSHYLNAIEQEPSKLPQAVLSIPDVNLKVPVYEGVDNWALNAGLGLIPGTAELHSAGNIGIAGHRDGFFRSLKDIEIGHEIHLRTKQGIQRYSVSAYWVVAPEDVSVLDPTPESALTLVTCYPFYFVGSAPERFIVRATLSEENSSQQKNLDGG